MKKAVVFTLGCKVNDCESGSLMQGLSALGYAVSERLEAADLYILNTCAVTGEAEKKIAPVRGARAKTQSECADYRVRVRFAEQSAGVCFQKKRNAGYRRPSKE